MADREERAQDIAAQVAALRAEGCNCAQCVAVYTLRCFGRPSGEIKHAARGMAGGLGSGHNCGCVLGASLAFGVLTPGEGRPAMREATKISARMVEWFEGRFGSIECATLKKQSGIPCDALIEAACAASVEMLEKAGV